MVKYLFLILCLILCACEDQAASGYCTPPTVSQSELQFDSQGGVDSVSLNSRSWNFNSYYFGSENCNRYLDSDSDYCANNYCSGRSEIMRIECSWFELHKIDAYTTTVSVYPNETGEERKIGIAIDAGNCGISFMVTQSAE